MRAHADSRKRVTCSPRVFPAGARPGAPCVPRSADPATYRSSPHYVPGRIAAGVPTILDRNEERRLFDKYAKFKGLPDELWCAHTHPACLLYT